MVFKTNTSKNIALIASVFPPINISGSVQLQDLSQEFFQQGYSPTVMVPSSDIENPWELENVGGVRVLRLKAPKIREIGYFRRTLGEVILSFIMLRNIKKSPLCNMIWDGIVWYSPTIFFGPLVKVLKTKSSCQSYLIIRDIFPEWAVDLGLINRGIIYQFFKYFEHYQYSVANVIGVQTAANLSYFNQWKKHHGGRVEVLHNWLARAPNIGSSFSVANSILAGRLIFVYTGNMGVAQGMELLVDLAESFCKRSDIGFLFVGRGSAVKQLLIDIKKRGLDNVLFHEELPSSEIPGLLAQCHVGLIALDQKHKTHNIPGKFLSYMQTGLPVLAAINRGNDLKDLILKEGVGKVCSDYSLDTLRRFTEELAHDCYSGINYVDKCNALSEKLFSPKTTVSQIASALNL